MKMWRDSFFLGLLSGEGTLPFGFRYSKQESDEYLRTCNRSLQEGTFDGGRLYSVTYEDAEKLKVIIELKLFDKYPAADWSLRFENASDSPTKIIDRVRSAELVFTDPLEDGEFILHSANGAPSTPKDFVMREKSIRPHGGISLGGKGGRSSNEDLPFFRLDTALGAAVFGVGWSGQWRGSFHNTGGALRFAYGLEETHFRLYPHESVTMPSLTVLFWEGERILCHSAFRRLVFDHYMPRVKGRNGDPYLFCNTCFTRYGGWLNECNEENQISLIKAMEPLGVESVIVDAGWFVGGWPSGAGNWDADPEKYPGGMGTVAEAAHDNGMKYGLWFELERVVKGTDIEREHPEWLLYNRTSVGDTWGSDNMLLNMAIPEARAYALGIVEGYLKIPGFTAYRQDFNVDPLVYWRSADAPDRIGMTELTYLAGLYEFLDAIRLGHPDCFMDGCASGGRRIDMRMIRHFHTHQKTDYWFNNRVDQNSLFALSHYLPSTCFTSHLNRYDDYSVDSSIAATLCLGWIADAEDFPKELALKQIKRYHQVRPLLNDQFFPLTPFAEENDAALASQYHDRALDAGVVLLYLRDDFSLWNSLPRIKLQGLAPDRNYRVTCLNDGVEYCAAGDALLRELPFTVPSTHGYSAVFRYEGC